MKSKNARLIRMKQAVAAFKTASAQRNFSATPVIVHYTPLIGRVVVDKRGEEYVFRYSREDIDPDVVRQEMNPPRNVFAMRDAFQRVKTPTDALDFLSSTGEFSGLSNVIEWSEFKKWQRVAYLAQERSQLAAAIMGDVRTGRDYVEDESFEILFAMQGDPSFFAETAFVESRSPTARAENEEFRRKLHEETRFHRSMEQAKLASWFLSPPAAAKEHIWIPNVEKPTPEVLRRASQEGFEFTMPRNAIRPVTFIRTTCTLQAVAAAIYADWSDGEEYRICEVCKCLFKIGLHKDKKYCDRDRCKNTAHQRNRRKRLNNSGESKRGK